MIDHDPNWAASLECLEWIHWRIHPSCGSILELGSGWSTGYLTDQLHFVTSIEHDSTFLDKVPGVRYIYAPIEPYGPGNEFPASIQKRTSDQIGWYNREVLKRELADADWSLIFVDGPPNDFGRAGFFVNLDLFNTNCPIVLDDMHRVDDLYTAQLCAQKLRRNLTIYNDRNNKRPFGVIE